MAQYTFSMPVEAASEDEAWRVLEQQIHTVFESGESLADYGDLEQDDLNIPPSVKTLRRLSG